MEASMSPQSNDKPKSKWFNYENGLLLLLSFTFGLVFFDRNAVSVLTPFIMEDFDLSNTQLGMLASVLSLSWALSAYFIGAWSDRSGTRKPFLIVAIIVFSLCSVLSGFAGSFIFLLVARVVMGIAEGPFLPICFSIMNVESSPKRRGINAGILQNVFASLLGTTMAPIILVYLAELYDWRVAFFITGIPGLICAFLVWRFVREPKPHRDQGVSDVVEEVVSDAVVEESPAVVTKDKQKSGWGALSMLRERNVLICALVSCCMVAWFLIGLTFLPVFYTSSRGFEPSDMAVIMAGMGVATLLCGFLVPGLSDRIGRKPAMIIFNFLGVITPLAALYFTGPNWMLGILMAIGWSATGAFPLFMGVIPGETVSHKFSATAMGLVVGTGELIGGVSGPLAAGWVADQTSLTAPIVIIGICALCAGTLSLFLTETAPSKTKTN